MGGAFCPQYAFIQLVFSAHILIKVSNTNESNKSSVADSSNETRQRQFKNE